MEINNKFDSLSENWSIKLCMILNTFWPTKSFRKNDYIFTSNSIYRYLALSKYENLWLLSYFKIPYLSFLFYWVYWYPCVHSSSPDCEGVPVLHDVTCEWGGHLPPLSCDRNSSPNHPVAVQWQGHPRETGSLRQNTWVHSKKWIILTLISEI